MWSFEAPTILIYFVDFKVSKHMLINLTVLKKQNFTSKCQLCNSLAESFVMTECLIKKDMADVMNFKQTDMIGCKIWATLSRCVCVFQRLSTFNSVQVFTNQVVIGWQGQCIHHKRSYKSRRETLEEPMDAFTLVDGAHCFPNGHLARVITLNLSLHYVHGVAR